MSARPHATRVNRVDALMEQASEALAATRYFECERHATGALETALAAHDYDRMARILLPLQEARRHKRQLAAEKRKGVVRLHDPETLELLLTGRKKITAGCYLIEPLLVGADARDLREHADTQEVPIIVLAREPQTRFGDWPIVMIGPVTVRTRVRPPAKEKPDAPWMLAACEALGDAAIESVDPGMDPQTRVERLAALLATVVDHEKLHQALAEACRDAAAAVRRAEANPKARRAASVVAPEELSEEEDEAP